MAIYRHRLQPYEHMVFFHYLTEGGCKVRLSGDGSVLEVSEGDIVVLPRDDGHFIGSDLQIAPLGAEDVNSNDAEACTDVVQLRHGGGGATTRFVCGHMLCGSKRQFGMPPAMWRRTAPS